MRRPAALIVPALLLALIAAAWLPARASSDRRTAIDPADRYEIIQSGNNRNAIVRVDKFTGETARLMDRSGNLGWRTLRFERPIPPEEITAGQVNFRLSAFADAPGTAYLWNVNTGSAWHVLIPHQGEPLWRRVLDP
jgi:hypothetical protein